MRGVGAGVSDESLLAALALGDGGVPGPAADAADELVRRFRPRVVGLARTILGDSAGADDVAQETFLRAWRHAASFDPRRGSVAAWLLTIARRIALDAVRARVRRRTLPVDPLELAQVEQASGDDPAREAGVAEEARQVRKALAVLPAEQARALVLATWYGATAAEIAAHENIPLGTAKTRLRAGLIKLRVALTPALRIPEAEPRGDLPSLPRPKHFPEGQEATP